ncbi:pyruvate kinase [Gulosibacter molinativorax]|uniref:pyruvate kinase n=1 Tax=Gulosibacter molinativorax TaxID=256821 RepID=A0ABT7C7D2_9MICO|nr:pyruvate kinase [Gulosibacter molinativorax]MDJ1371118.1 pyruvate kinase [Gulosibacter molinativorax]QUY61478.1 Pyruvate kinase [Gulosibacter molinativorax]
MAHPEDRILSLAEIAGTIRSLLQQLEEAEQAATMLIEAVLPEHRASARNLVHYVAIRQGDLRPLQRSLAAYGLSSLGRMESMVRSWLLTVLETVSALAEGRHRKEIWGPLDKGDGILTRNRDEVLGEAHSDRRSTRIMVTMPSEAATNPALVQRMGRAGMDIARVNCAHDGEAEWAAMIESVRALPDDVLVAMDLGGPKLRTGPLVAGPQVLKVKPTRDDCGRVTTPARILLVEADQLPENPDFEATPVIIPVTGLGALSLQIGDKLKTEDARGRSRKLAVTDLAPGQAEVSCEQTTYFVAEMELDTKAGDVITVGALPEVRQHLYVREGDRIEVVRDMSPQPATQVGPHRIGCSLDAAFTDASHGERILFDDGKISGIIEDITPDVITVRVTRAGVDGVKLRAEKGINLPDTTLRIPALTEEDRSHLPFVAAHADTVNISFVRSHEDVADLIAELERLDAEEIGITLKIETQQAFENLPRMLLEAMRWGGVGVMIARGDLAVELGFERLAEVQEEILWLCEAAHVPVIWATQVLDTLARTGLPSRAEVTDAAMGRRAEAVMLNKGPFIVEAIEALTSILERMGGHISKKRSLLRPLESFDLDELSSRVDSNAKRD